MTPDDLRKIVIQELSNIAPDSDPGSLKGTEDMREALDLDSMDFLNLIAAIHTRLKVNVPEADYRQLRTLSGAVDYLFVRLPGQTP